MWMISLIDVFFVGHEICQGWQQDEEAGELSRHHVRPDERLLAHPARREAHLPPDLQEAAGQGQRQVEGHLLLPHPRGQGGRRQSRRNVAGLKDYFKDKELKISAFYHLINNSPLTKLEIVSISSALFWLHNNRFY